MELKIIGKREEPLLSRTMVEAEISFDKTTPSKSEIKNKLAKELGKDGKLIVVKGIYTEYGLKKAKNISYVYENEKIMERIQPKRKGKEDEAKEDAKEAKAEEKADEQREEPKKVESKGETKEQKAAEEKKQ